MLVIPKSCQFYAVSSEQLMTIDSALATDLMALCVLPTAIRLNIGRTAAARTVP